MRIQFTKEEVAEYELLDEKGQVAFVEAKERRLERISIKVPILATMLLEALEEAEEENLYRQGMKHLAKRTRDAAIQVVDVAFSSKGMPDKDKKKSAADFIYHATRAADLDFEKLINTLTGEKDEGANTINDTDNKSTV